MYVFPVLYVRMHYFDSVWNNQKTFFLCRKNVLNVNGFFMNFKRFYHLIFFFAFAFIPRR